MPRQENTKKLILEAALKLFSERGYDKVKISDITDVVGCTPGALYKHFENKEQVYAALLSECKSRFEDTMNRGRNAFMQDPQTRDNMINMTVEQSVEQMKLYFFMPIGDERITQLRKLMVVEQFLRDDLSDMYDEHYVFNQFEHFSKLFQYQIDGGVIKDGDTYAMAVSFVSPINVFIGMYDRHPEKKEWILEQIERHVREFYDKYRV